MPPMEVAYQFAGVALPDGKEGGHVDASEVFLAVGAEIFEKNVTESHFADALAVEKAEGLSHARFVDGVDALRRDEDFVKRQTQRPRLLTEKFPADAVHGDAVIGFRDGGEKSHDAELLLLEQHIESHGAVFAAAPAEEDGFG